MLWTKGAVGWIFHFSIYENAPRTGRSWAVGVGVRIRVKFRLIVRQHRTLRVPRRSAFGLQVTVGSGVGLVRTAHWEVPGGQTEAGSGGGAATPGHTMSASVTACPTAIDVLDTFSGTMATAPAACRQERSADEMEEGRGRTEAPRSGSVQERRHGAPSYIVHRAASKPANEATRRGEAAAAAPHRRHCSNRLHRT